MSEKKKTTNDSDITFRVKIGDDVLHLSLEQFNELYSKLEKWLNNLKTIRDKVYSNMPKENKSNEPGSGSSPQTTIGVRLEPVVSYPTLGGDILDNYRTWSGYSGSSSVYPTINSTSYTTTVGVDDVKH